MLRLMNKNSTNVYDLRRVFQARRTPDQRRYNRPVHNEIAVLMLGSGNPETEHANSSRDIVIYSENGASFSTNLSK